MTTMAVFVLVNDEERHSLWLSLTDVPADWRQVYGVADRAVCRDYTEQNWSDIRLKSLREKLAAGRALISKPIWVWRAFGEVEWNSMTVPFR
jgi:uncharacterized protein YbdZ (MbtH family)